jgi:glycosyltransferase involved in cell wall biosynthesis
LGERYHRLTIPLDEMPSLYRSANVVLHLALDESFGNVYIESLASGVPLVGPDLAHTRWIFGEDALLIDTGEISSIASALQRVIDGSWSLPSGAVERCVERFSWESIGRQYREFLVQVVARRRS